MEDYDVKVIIHIRYLDKLSQWLATDTPPLPAFFGLLKGGVSVENQDPSGACGGLFYLIFSTVFVLRFLTSNIV